MEVGYRIVVGTKRAQPPIECIELGLRVSDRRLDLGPGRYVRLDRQLILVGAIELAAGADRTFASIQGRDAQALAMLRAAYCVAINLVLS